MPYVLLTLHYLLIFRRRRTNDTWYTACVLCQET
jgi:hypothetical protein